jgi:hypothetical protein
MKKAKSHPGKLLISVSICIAIVVTVFAAGRSEQQPQGDETRTTQILWLGSSSTYFHDMPKHVADWLTRYAGRRPGEAGLCPDEAKMPARSDLVGRSGTAVYKYLDPDFRVEYGLRKGQTVLEKIRDGKYDFVIMQIPTDYLAGRGDNDRDAFVAGIATYTHAIRGAGGRPFFYEQGWGQDELFEAGDKLLFELAVEHNVPVVPCRSAWKRIREERPDLELHNLPDRTHPGTLGKYVNLCCFYAVLTGKAPVGLPVRDVTYWPYLTDEQKKQARERLSKMTSTEPYMAQLAGWMRTRSIASKTVTLDRDTAGYFQKVAWQTVMKWKTSINSSDIKTKD